MQNGTVRIHDENGAVEAQVKQYDEIAEAMNLLKIELASINRKLDTLDDLEIAKDSLSKGQEIQYDKLVDRQFKINTDLAFRRWA